MKILVTGGAGYIGSTICSALEDNGHVPVVLDKLVTGRREFVEGRAFHEADVASSGPTFLLPSSSSNDMSSRGVIMSSGWRLAAFAGRCPSLGPELY